MGEMIIPCQGVEFHELGYIFVANAIQSVQCAFFFSWWMQSEFVLK